MMKMTALKAAVALLGCTAVLVGCGGGGDDNAGSVTQLAVVPTEIEVSGENGCAVDAGPVRVVVVGGAAPYRLENLFPTAVELDRATVDSRNGSFNVTFIGQCLDAEAAILVIDANDRQVQLALKNTDGSSEE